MPEQVGQMNPPPEFLSTGGTVRQWRTLTTKEQLQELNQKAENAQIDRDEEAERATSIANFLQGRMKMVVRPATTPAMLPATTPVMLPATTPATTEEEEARTAVAEASTPRADSRPRGKSNRCIADGCPKFRAAHCEHYCVRCFDRLRPDAGPNHPRFAAIKRSKKRKAGSSAVGPPVKVGRRTIKTLSVMPGRMGLHVVFGGGGLEGAFVKAIGPTCAFGDKIRVGDRILTVDGKPVSSGEDFQCEAGRTSPRVLGILVAHDGEARGGGGGGSGPGLASGVDNAKIDAFLRSRRFRQNPPANTSGDRANLLVKKTTTRAAAADDKMSQDNGAKTGQSVSISVDTASAKRKNCGNQLGDSDLASRNQSNPHARRLVTTASSNNRNRGARARTRVVASYKDESSSSNIREEERDEDNVEKIVEGGTMRQLEQCVARLADQLRRANDRMEYLKTRCNVEG